jgi:hypothetical protein
MRGNCYVTSEALYHLMGGKSAGWKPMTVRTAKDVHWYLQHSSGLILDATAHQFPPGDGPDYSKGRGRGFLTKGPSHRAQQLMQTMLWQSGK